MRPTAPVPPGAVVVWSRASPRMSGPRSAVPWPNAYQPRSGAIRPRFIAFQIGRDNKGQKTRTTFDSFSSSPAGHRGNATAIRTNTAPPSDESSNLRAGRTLTVPQRRSRPRVVLQENSLRVAKHGQVRLAVSYNHLPL